MRILHLASFAGNSGDSLNHNGFRTWIEGFFPGQTTWSEFEIRDIYRGEKTFAHDLVYESKDSDLLIVGGGNYFELWPENTSTGTSLDFSEETLRSISCPIFFNALGVDSGQGVGFSAKANFSKFINGLTSSDKFLVSVRNDGSFQTIESIVGNTDGIQEIPDHGFFGNPVMGNSLLHKAQGTTIGINLAIDMPDIRFEGFASTESFLSEFSETLVEIHNQTQCVFKFFPHVKSDLSAISEIVDLLPDKIARQYVQVVKYDTSSKGALQVFDEYLDCDLILANRFHANVFAISKLIPVIGISNYVQIRNLYSRLSLERLCFDVSNPGFQQGLTDFVIAANSERDLITQQLSVSMGDIRNSRANFDRKLAEWLSGHGLLQDLDR